ncbi:MAG: DUF2867 domain-containing protein, partial [Anaerolineae bacterium]
MLVTGATGYVGGRLVPRLLAKGYPVRVMARDLDRLAGRDWLDRVEAVRGDVFEPESLANAMQGVDAAYYNIHSMHGGAGFHERDLLAARLFASAASEAGVGRILYLGGLGDPATDLSPHLRSRHETGEALRSAGVPVTEFRAAIVVGSGSVSFEMIRYLTERLPVMICPRWVYTRVQPIAIRNVLDYLVAALDTPDSTGRVIEIGGADVLTYGGMMLGYADVRGLKRTLLPVPVLTPRLSSYWVHLVTPIPASIAKPLIRGLRNEVIVRDDEAKRLFPDIEPMAYRTAVSKALDKLEAREVETSWSDSLGSSQGDVAPAELRTDQGMIIERRQVEVDADADTTYRAFSGLGGERGWLFGNVLWHLRGTIDRVVGGVGYRRGRRHPDDLRVGDALDFWRVEAVEPGRMIRLRAEMKVPGRAWLQLETRPIAAGRSQLAQTAFFAPKGLAGLAYWYGLYPLHAVIFSRMPRAIARRAAALRETEQQSALGGPAAGGSAAGGSAAGGSAAG